MIAADRLIVAAVGAGWLVTYEAPTCLQFDRGDERLVVLATRRGGLSSAVLSLPARYHPDPLLAGPGATRYTRWRVGAGSRVDVRDLIARLTAAPLSVPRARQGASRAD